jgi:hypothetical protein
MDVSPVTARLYKRKQPEMSIAARKTGHPGGSAANRGIKLTFGPSLEWRCITASDSEAIIFASEAA